jgi:lipid-A-disaccharide synthase
MLCILPFEPKAYEGTGVAARFVGHPFAERPAPSTPAAYRASLGIPVDRTTLALVPGSRPSEIDRILPHMLGAAERLLALHPGAQFVVPLAPTLSRAQLELHLAAHPALDVRLVDGKTAEVVGASDGAIVKSGTSTLEAALMLRPMIVVYRVSWLTYVVGRMLVKIEFFSLVNLLAGRRIVPELLQGEASAERMAAELEALLSAGPAWEAQLAGLREVRGALGEPGAPLRVAEEVAGVLAS